MGGMNTSYVQIRMENPLAGKGLASIAYALNLPSKCFLSGGIFDESNKADVEAFELAVKKINQDRYLLPRSTVTGLIEKVSLEGSYETSKKGEKDLEKNPT